MEHARIVSLPLPGDAIEGKLTQREWGIQRSYKTRNGNEICTAAAFKNPFKLD